MLKNLQAHPNSAGQDDIRRDAIGCSNGQDPGQPAVRGFKYDKDNQPDAENSQPEDQQALHETFEKSHYLARPSRKPHRASFPHIKTGHGRRATKSVGAVSGVSIESDKRTR